MIVRVELSSMSGCTVCLDTVVISGDDVCCSVVWLVCLCSVLCGPSC